MKIFRTLLILYAALMVALPTSAYILDEDGNINLYNDVRLKILSTDGERINTSLVSLSGGRSAIYSLETFEKDDLTEEEFNVLKIEDFALENYTKSVFGILHETRYTEAMELSENAFTGADKLERINFYHRISLAGETPLSQIPLLNTVYIGFNIPAGLFKDCKKVKTIYFDPSYYNKTGVVEIEDGAFEGASINTIQTLFDIPFDVKESAFEGLNLNECILIVNNKDAATQYRAHQAWGKFKTIRYVENGKNIDDILETKLDVKLDIAPDQVSIKVGETAEIKASVSVDNENVNDAVIEWKSLNEDIATVTDGIITAISEGTTTITATYKHEGADAVSKTVEVTVLPKDRVDVTLTVMLDKAPLILHNADLNEFTISLGAHGAGYVIESVSLGDENITDKMNEGGLYTIEPLNESKTLYVVYKDLGNSDVNALIQSTTVKVAVINGVIQIDGASEGAVASLYDVTGRKIMSTSQRSITTSHHGMIILTIDNQKFKLTL